MVTEEWEELYYRIITFIYRIKRLDDNKVFVSWSKQWMKDRESLRMYNFTKRILVILETQMVTTKTEDGGEVCADGKMVMSLIVKMAVMWTLGQLDRANRPAFFTETEFQIQTFERIFGGTLSNKAKQK